MVKRQHREPAPVSTLVLASHQTRLKMCQNDSVHSWVFSSFLNTLRGRLWPRLDVNLEFLLFQIKRLLTVMQSNILQNGQKGFVWTQSYLVLQPSNELGQAADLIVQTFFLHVSSICTHTHAHAHVTHLLGNKDHLWIYTQHNSSLLSVYSI